MTKISCKIYLLIFIVTCQLAIAGIKDAIPGNLKPTEYPNLTKFIALHRCSREFESLQDEHFIKGDQIDRIINAKRLERVIAQEKLDSLKVPHKCLIKDENGNYRVLSENLNWENRAHRFKKNQISLTEVKQLATLTEKTAYTDLHAGNIGRTKTGQIAICDTENQSFILKGTQARKSDLIYYLYESLQPIANNNETFMRAFMMDQDSASWLHDRQRQAILDRANVVSLKVNPAYDTELNYEDVKKEWSAYCEMRDKQKNSSLLSKCYWSIEHCK